MLDPAYVRVNGMPVLFIIDVGEMYQIFGSDAAVVEALAELRTAAKAQGCLAFMSWVASESPTARWAKTHWLRASRLPGPMDTMRSLFTITRLRRRQ